MLEKLKARFEKFYTPCPITGCYHWRERFKGMFDWGVANPSTTRSQGVVNP
jgi:hypothetical protein